MVTAIFPAAGSSTRMKSGVNKNFLQLGGAAILLRTLKTFSRVERVSNLIVVVGANEVQTVEKLLRGADGLKPWRVTVGGSERQFSIANGLKLLTDDAEIILVHDAARPLITTQTINAVIDAAKIFGGAIVAVPAKDTVKVIDVEGFVRCTPPRSELVLVQTPQGFRRKILLDAYARAAAENFLGTDDACLVERIGARVKVVTGTYDNIKVTTPEDLDIAETFLRRRNS